MSESEERAEIKPVDVTQRAFDFAVRIVNLCKYLEENSDVGRSVREQLLDAGTAIGANLEEAVAGQSRPDFIHKSAIALKEARETNYWLRLVLATTNFPDPVKGGVVEMEIESSAIAKIIGKRIVSTKKNC